MLNTPASPKEEYRGTMQHRFSESVLQRYDFYFKGQRKTGRTSQ
ncbi:hypothetical protein HMPREF2531_03597 [Bacteroides intestinalis]|uniref:Uncharacterized protein n=2 Tax=Bacteroides TaxID=816 RepID=A0AB73ADX9_BACFG|nr:hypothetical protein M119_4456 [Bacteroides fragilis str. 3783N1-6]KXT45448.1 hypothetical protein HMPREF2531_03597 [Bacteroides intestinalis]